MRKFLNLLAASLLCACATGHSQVDVVAPDTVFERLAAAYNGDALLSAKTISLYEDNRLPFESHDYGADFHEFSLQRRHQVIDFDNRRMRTDFLTQIGSLNFDGREIIDDDRMIFVEYRNDTYQDMGAVDFDQLMGRPTRASDVLLAREVLSNPEQAATQGEAMWLGRMHDVIELARDEAPSLTIYVNQKTGAIAYMRRIVGEITVHYTFDRPVLVDGLTYAREFSVFADDELLYLSLARRVALNPAEADFGPGAGVVQEPPRIDQSEMTVDEVRPGIFQVGQGTIYSTLFDTDEGLVAFGTEEGFTERLTAFREATGNVSGLAYAIVANHHRLEAIDASSALEAGATLLVTRSARAGLLEDVGGDCSEDRIVAIDDSRSVGGVEVLSVPTAHAAEVLVAHHATADVLAQAYHYDSPYRDEPFFALHSGVTLHQALVARRLRPQFLLSAGGRKLIDWDEFEEAVLSYDPTPCRRQRLVCEGL